MSSQPILQKRFPKIKYSIPIRMKTPLEENALGELLYDDIAGPIAIKANEPIVIIIVPIIHTIVIAAGVMNSSNLMNLLNSIPSPSILNHPWQDLSQTIQRS
jgi:hypothetical protein